MGSVNDAYDYLFKGKVTNADVCFVFMAQVIVTCIHVPSFVRLYVEIIREL